MSPPRRARSQAVGGTVDLALPHRRRRRRARDRDRPALAALAANPTLQVDAGRDARSPRARRSTRRRSTRAAPGVDTQIAALDPPARLVADRGSGCRGRARRHRRDRHARPARRTALVRGPDLSGEGDGIDHYGHGTFMAGLIAGDGTASAGAADAPLRRRARRDARLGQGRGRRRLDDRVARHRRHRLGRQPPRHVRHRRAEPLVRCRRADAVPVQPAVGRGRGRVGVGDHGRGLRRQRRRRSRDLAGQRPVRHHRRRGRHRGYARRPTTTSCRRGRAASSFHGYAKPDVVAPGVSVVSLRAPGSTIDVTHPEGRVDNVYFRGTGTSMSTAIVSGRGRGAAQPTIPRRRPTTSRARWSTVRRRHRGRTPARSTSPAPTRPTAQPDWWQHFPVAFHGLGRGFVDGMPWTASRWTASALDRDPLDGDALDRRPRWTDAEWAASRWTSTPLDRDAVGPPPAGPRRDGRRRHGRRRAGDDR